MVYARDLNPLFSQQRKREVSLKLFMKLYSAILEGGELSPEDSIFSLLSNTGATMTLLQQLTMDLIFYDQNIIASNTSAKTNFSLFEY